MLCNISGGLHPDNPFTSAANLLPTASKSAMFFASALIRKRNLQIYQIELSGCCAKHILIQLMYQPWSQGLRGETVTKTLVKFILSFQNFAKKIACTVRHNRIAIRLKTVVSHCACDFSPRRPWDRGC